MTSAITKAIALAAIALSVASCGEIPDTATHPIQNRQHDDGIFVEITPLTAQAIAAEAEVASHDN